MALNEFKTYLENEVIRKINDKITSINNYAMMGEQPLYLVDDITEILNVRSIWHKIANLIDASEKVNRTIRVNDVSRFRTLITKKGVCKIIASMRKKPHDLICKFFNYSENPPANTPSPLETPVEDYSFDVGPNNFYIKRLKHIFSAFKFETFYHINNITLDVFFPNHGIIVLFNKKINIFSSENVPVYLAAQNEILKKYIKLKEIRWIQFTAYDSRSVTQFDELIKDLIGLLIKN
jgi:hypothetical protein